MTFGSLFAGIGGIDLACERAGMRCIWQVEIDRACRKVLASHFPAVDCHDDVRRVRAWLEPRNAKRNPRRIVRPDLICAGWPCQDVSVAGRRAGLAGARSGLWWELRRILALLRPTWFLGENVPGLLSSNRGRDMGAVLWSLGKLGYGWAYRVLDARWFGVPQRRRRVFIIGCLRGIRRAATVLFESACLPWDTPPGRKAGNEVAHALTARAHGGRRLDPSGEDYVVFNWQTGGSKDFLRPSNESTSAISATQVPAVAGPLVAHAGSAACLARHSGLGDSEFVNLVAHTLMSEGADASEDGTGRGVTLVAKEAGVRRLTPRECERLQGLPDSWTEGHSDSARYRMVGNSVAVPVVEWIAKRIMENVAR